MADAPKEGGRCRAGLPDWGVARRQQRVGSPQWWEVGGGGGSANASELVALGAQQFVQLYVCRIGICGAATRCLVIAERTDWFGRLVVRHVHTRRNARWRRWCGQIKSARDRETEGIFVYVCAVCAGRGKGGGKTKRKLCTNRKANKQNELMNNTDESYRILINDIERKTKRDI